MNAAFCFFSCTRTACAYSGFDPPNRSRIRTIEIPRDMKIVVPAQGIQRAAYNPIDQLVRNGKAAPYQVGLAGLG